MSPKSLPLIVSVVVAVGVLITGCNTSTQLPDLGVAAQIDAQESHSSLGAFPTRIVIPSIGVDTVILNVSRTYDSWDTSRLTWQAGHMEETAYPGEGSNVVIVAHRYLGYNAETMQPIDPGAFVALDQLGPGDTVQAYAEGRVYVYEVTEQMNVATSDVWVIGPTETETLTLMTCSGWNPEHATFDHFLVVRAGFVEIREVMGLPIAVEPQEAPSFLARLLERAIGLLCLGATTS